jgi:twitching motility protein PilT
MQVESAGELVPVEIRNSAKPLSAFRTETIALNLIMRPKTLQAFLRTGSCDLSYALPGRRLPRQHLLAGGNVSIVCRKRNPTSRNAAFQAMYQIAKEKNGSSSSHNHGLGKTDPGRDPGRYQRTPLGAHRYARRPVDTSIHKKATFSSAEAMDFDAYTGSLRAAPRRQR